MDKSGSISISSSEAVRVGWTFLRQGLWCWVTRQRLILTAHFTGK